MKTHIYIPDNITTHIYNLIPNKTYQLTPVGYNPINFESSDDYYIIKCDDDINRLLMKQDLIHFKPIEQFRDEQINGLLNQ